MSRPGRWLAATSAGRRLADRSAVLLGPPRRRARQAPACRGARTGRGRHWPKAGLVRDERRCGPLGGLEPEQAAATRRLRGTGRASRPTAPRAHWSRAPGPSRTRPNGPRQISLSHGPSTHNQHTRAEASQIIKTVQPLNRI